MFGEKKEKNVLLIDDDEDTYIFISVLLGRGKRFRYHLEWASTFEKGLRAVRENKYDAILLDYTLDNAKTGVEFLIEAAVDTERMPFIMLTQYDDNELDMRLLQHGAMDYVLKSTCRVEDLERILHYAIERKAMIDELKIQCDKSKKVSADFAEFIDIVATDFVPHIKKIDEDVMSILRLKPHTKVSKVAQGISQENKKIQKIIHSFQELDLSGSCPVKKRIL